MKIAIIVRSLKFGGMERAACNQADAFFQWGCDVDLIYFSDKNNQITPFEKGVKLYHMNINKIMKKNPMGILWNIFSKILNIFIRRSSGYFKAFYCTKIFVKELEKLELDKKYDLTKIFVKELEKLELDKKYDLIIIRGQGTFEQIWRFKDERSIKINVNVSTKNTSYFKDRLISRSYFNDCHVNCNSLGGKAFYEKKFQRENVKPLSLNAIRNPFFKERVISLTKEKNNLIPKKPYIIGVGRLVNAKNFELLIDMFIYLKNNFDFKYNLVLVGEGSQRKSLEKKVLKNNLEKEVLFVGYQKNPYNWMSNSEAFVLTSKVEGLCGVLIEAMCCKTRVIATKFLGGVFELMNNSKTTKSNLVDPKANILAEKVVEVLKKPKEYYFKDYDKLLDSLKPSYIVKQWLEIYKKV